MKIDFTVRDAAGVLADPDSPLDGILVVNGVDSAVAVNITKKDVGIYTAEFETPSYTTLQLRIEGTVGGVDDKGYVLQQVGGAAGMVGGPTIISTPGPEIP